MEIFGEDPFETFLEHYGIARRSGRYPWGSGDNSVQRSRSFLEYIKHLLGMGLSLSEIGKGLGEQHPEGELSTLELRAIKTIALNEIKAADVAFARSLSDKGVSNIEIGKRFDPPRNESYIRGLLKDSALDRKHQLTTISNFLQDEVDSKGFIDIGSGAEQAPVIGGVARTTFDVAVAMLKDKGYVVHNIAVPTAIGNDTPTKVLCPPGTEWKDVQNNQNKIQLLGGQSDDNGRSILGIKPPLSIDPKRVQVVYGPDGGSDRDGVIFVRPGVEDVSIGANRYAQVRILVDGTHYLKGMAVYKDDLPKGVDLQFNTNKKDTGNKLDAMKPRKEEDANPFGATVRQIIKVDDKGNEVLTSAMNIVGNKPGSNVEGGWDEWKDSMSSQFLSKQPATLAKAQLQMTYENRRDQLDSIMKLTNPAVRKKLLEDFSDDVDAQAVRLAAAAMPGQSQHVLLPNPDLKPTEVYAPNYNNGDRVVLIRHPHGGKFEIPELVVNNNHPSSKKLLGPTKDNPTPVRDAVLVHPDVAKKLSGADFDGDTVIVIPNNTGKVKSEPSLTGLKDFDPQYEYPGYEGMKTMSSAQTQIEMGMASNLITDMTLRGATSSELARAVRHSMVVIDAEKHGLNYKLSEERNGIAALKKKYQTGGASTLISRANSTVRGIPERKPRLVADGGPIDPKTGEKKFVPTNRMVNKRVVNKATGEVTWEPVLKTETSKRLAETNDAHTLSSGTKMEEIYADHANRMKSLANSARLEMLNTPNLKYSPSAKEVYKDQVRSLQAKLDLAVANRPIERSAQIIARANFKAIRAANPDMTRADEKKVLFQALEAARQRLGAQGSKIHIEDDEWEAIQAGAISNHRLTEILQKADMDRVKQLSMPKTQLLMTSTKTARAQQMLASGYTQAQVAEALGVSVTTLKNAI